MSARRSCALRFRPAGLRLSAPNLILAVVSFILCAVIPVRFHRWRVEVEARHVPVNVMETAMPIYTYIGHGCGCRYVLPRPVT